MSWRSPKLSPTTVMVLQMGVKRDTSAPQLYQSETKLQYSNSWMVSRWLLVNTVFDFYLCIYISSTIWYDPTLGENRKREKIPFEGVWRRLWLQERFCNMWYEYLFHFHIPSETWTRTGYQTYQYPPIVEFDTSRWKKPSGITFHPTDFSWLKQLNPMTLIILGNNFRYMNWFWRLWRNYNAESKLEMSSGRMNCIQRAQGLFVGGTFAWCMWTCDCK